MMRSAALCAALCSARPAAAKDPAAAAPSAAPRALDPAKFPVVEKTLKNGLQVRLLRDTSVPTVTYYTFFKVGSRNERQGITGISHLFEHMMFNGSAKYGPKEFDRQLESRGGHSNAFTSNDMTAYYEDFDRDALAMVVDLESDRMRALAINDLSLKNEREVVKEERRFRVDNDIGGMVDEQLEALAFVAHPYHWPVVGWMGDLETISRPQCEDYFHTYYAPNNAVLFVVGDFDTDATFALIEKSYGDIPAGPPVPPVAVYEPAQVGERRAQIRYPAQSPMLSLGYKAVEANHADAAALDVIQAVLSIGEGARLERTLVRQKEVATSVAAFFEWRHDPGLFKVILELPPGGKPQKALDALDAELDKLKATPLTDTELSRAKNILRGQTLRGLGTNNGKAHAFGEHELLFGHWKDLFGTLDRYEKVTVADVQRAAKTYLDSGRRSIVELVPTSPEATP